MLLLFSSLLSAWGGLSAGGLSGGGLSGGLGSSSSLFSLSSSSFSLEVLLLLDSSLSLCFDSSSRISFGFTHTYLFEEFFGFGGY